MPADAPSPLTPASTPAPSSSPGPSSSSAAPPGWSADAADADAVLTARQVRRRLALWSRWVSALLLVAGLATWGTIAVPNFVRFGCRAKQSEAKSGLKQFQAAQAAYHSEHDRYANDPAVDGGFVWPSTSRPRYRHGVAVAGVSGSAAYTAWAVATDEGIRGDLWTLDARGELVHVVDGCDR
jgi:type IV pilus assembly protein PilA